jgi:hypothetical protein
MDIISITINFFLINLDNIYKASILVIALINIVFVIRGWNLRRTEKNYKLYDMFLTLKGKYELYSETQMSITSQSDISFRSNLQSYLVKKQDEIALYSISINDEIKTVKNKKDLKRYLEVLFQIKDRKIEDQIEELRKICDYIFLKFNKKYKRVFKKFTKNPNVYFGLGITRADIFRIF